MALPEDADLAQELVGRAAELAQQLNGRWVAFVICNDALPSPRAENALRQAELAMRSGGTVLFCEGEDISTDREIALEFRPRDRKVGRELATVLGGEPRRPSDVAEW